MIAPILLPSGPVFLAEPGRESPGFAAGLWFPRGSRHEAPHERGFSHFLEHMFFKGTARRDAFELSRVVERTGGYINAFTERDCVCIHCTVPAQDWRLALDVLADMAFGSTLPADEFERERDVILSEILQTEEDPEECSHDAFLERFWPGHPAALKIAGTADDMANADRNALLHFYKEHFGPDSAVLSVSGGPAPEEMAVFFDEAVAAAQKSTGRAGNLSGAPRADASGVRTARSDTAPVPRIFSGYTKASAAQTYFYEAVQIDSPFGKRDFHILAALNGIVGENASSRLFQRLRERQGLCYSVYSAFSLSNSECLWLAQAAVADRRMPECVTAMDEELDRVGSGDLSDSECEDAARRLSGGFSLALEDPDFRMRRLAKEYLADGEVLSAEAEKARYASVSKDDILAMAGRLLGDRPRSRYAYGKIGKRTAAGLGLEVC
ncbi:MAG: pitrilysin family protein [Rectinemataceae bacterium]